LYIVVL
jgi:hypothetical protein